MSPVRIVAWFSSARAVAKQSAKDIGWAALISAACKTSSFERETMFTGKALRIASISFPLSIPDSRIVL